MRLIKRLRESDFARSVATLGTGTILAQAIVVSASPILTRLYSPEDFGLVALFAAIVGSVTPAICGKFEVAVVVGKTLSESRQLLGIALITALALSIISLAVLFVLHDEIIHVFNADALADWMFFVPLSLFATGVLISLNYYSNRLHEYHRISQSKVIVALVGVVMSVVLGLLGLGYGLLLGSVLSVALTAGWLLYLYRHDLRRGVLRVNARKRVLVKRYRDFPMLNASTGLLDGLALALPVFFLSHYFTETVVGYYALMMRVSMIPLGFISTSVSQVNLKKVADLAHQNSSIRPYLIKISLVLSLIVAPFAVLLILYAPPIFAWVFGDEWREAGRYLQILMPALALRFVVSTISTTFGATGNNHLAALWKVSSFVITLGVLLLAAPRLDVFGVFIALSITDVALYGFYYALAWRAAGHPIAYR